MRQDLISTVIQQVLLVDRAGNLFPHLGDWLQNTIVRDLVPPGEKTGVTCSITWEYVFCEQGPMVPHLVPPPIPQTGASIHRANIEVRSARDNKLVDKV